MKPVPGKSGLRRFLLLEGALLAAIIAGSLLWEARRDAGGKESRIVKGPCLHDVRKDGVTVLWETEGDRRGVVEYGPTVSYGGGSGKRAATSVCRTNIHEHVIRGLVPDTAYHYRVMTGKMASGDHVFRTAPGGPSAFSFVVYGDSRGSYPPQRSGHGEVVGAIVEEGLPDIAFHTGDLVELGGSCAERPGDFGWGPEFFHPAAPLMAEVPLYPVAGNHEYYVTPPPHALLDPPLILQAYFPLIHLKTWYSFAYGCARFIVIDSNSFTETGDFRPGSEQYSWIKAELGRDDLPLKIVLLHHPPFSSRKPCESRRLVLEHLVPLFEENGVDAVFAGHDHYYERSLKDGIWYVTTAGGGAPLYEPDRPDLNPYSVFRRSVRHYCRVDASPGFLDIQARDTGGAVFDGVSIKLHGN